MATHVQTITAGASMGPSTDVSQSQIYPREDTPGVKIPIFSWDIGDNTMPGMPASNDIYCSDYVAIPEAFVFTGMGLSSLLRFSDIDLPGYPAGTCKTDIIDVKGYKEVRVIVKTTNNPDGRFFTICGLVSVGSLPTVMPSAVTFCVVSRRLGNSPTGHDDIDGILIKNGIKFSLSHNAGLTNPSYSVTKDIDDNVVIAVSAKYGTHSLLDIRNGLSTAAWHTASDPFGSGPDSNEVYAGDFIDILPVDFLRWEFSSVIPLTFSALSVLSTFLSSRVPQAWVVGLQARFTNNSDPESVDAWNPTAIPNGIISPTITDWDTFSEWYLPTMDAPNSKPYFIERFLSRVATRGDFFPSVFQDIFEGKLDRVDYSYATGDMRIGQEFFVSGKASDTSIFNEKDSSVKFSDVNLGLYPSGNATFSFPVEGDFMQLAFVIPPYQSTDPFTGAPLGNASKPQFEVFVKRIGFNG